jgi:hypothetical protein
MIQVTQVPDECRDRNWLGFTPATPPPAAEGRFVERYGAAPQYAVAAPNTLLIGPVPADAPRQMALEVGG